MFSVDDAAGVSADATKVGLVYGREVPDVFEENLRLVAYTAERGRTLGAPIVVEPTLWGQRAEAFEPIVANAPLPVYIADGSAAVTDVEVLEMVRSAMDVGGSDVMFGRNVWQRDDPGDLVDAIKRIAHEDASVEEAARRL